MASSRTVGAAVDTGKFVGSAADLDPIESAARIRRAFDFDVSERHGCWADSRKAMRKRFEALGGLTVPTSMGGQQHQEVPRRARVPGFTLVDDIAALVFVNTHQTLNGQVFTLAHEFAHVWRAPA